MKKLLVGVTLGAALCLPLRQARAEFANVINLPPGTPPAALGSNTQLNLFSGGSLTAGFEVGAAGITSFNLELNVLGGLVDDGLAVYRGGTVNLVEGTIRDDATVFDGATLNISGGSIGENFQALADARVNISGGSLDDDFNAAEESIINLYGTEFFLNGTNLDLSLTVGVPLKITQRNVPLVGRLASGDSFGFELGTDASGDTFDEDAELFVTLIQPGDFEGDGDVDVADLLALQRGESIYPVGPNALADWQTAFGLGEQVPSILGDFDDDSDVDVADLVRLQQDTLAFSTDLSAWTTTFGAGEAVVAAVGVPEPCVWSLCCTTASVVLISRRRLGA